ncbi:hypothetical protein MNQ95_13645 [Pseudoxanthomonas daejeonensis]|uniref:hypothetical protein n=1 Tax=Pseudoxanthomonas daejeonensis TaxID=266062 RepID=UPI001F548350|nr:hypothetical protein [Pseudoxanthomonas daejeonensis]UNK57161.1 hypothetical protein MNQ95_13645 [Pseudoxanthomonas daejeonensis]
MIKPAYCPLSTIRTIDFTGAGLHRMLCARLVRRDPPTNRGTTLRYEATIDSETLEIIDKKTQSPVDAVAVIPDHLPDLERLVAMVPRDLAEHLARLAAWRALGMEGVPTDCFSV